ncbi:MAG TPA: GTPase, partial [Candidatus Limnocylindria bacterium]|nr:GTPase [Candidatus Limnocylindria bacterium]
MSVGPCLEALDEAIAAGTALGIDTAAATAVRETARERARFAGDAYVLALVGGTGVGKSTLLNALAGAEVSPASPRRPTTSEAVAWLPADRRGELAELIAWLGITQIREHAPGQLPDVAVLDLPDIDSIASEHRAKVDALL